MGFDARITRMNITSGECNNPITLEEWYYVIEKNLDIRSVGSIDGINPLTKDKIKIKCLGLAVWKHVKENREVELYYKDGNVGVYGYDADVVKKMKQLAIQLDAKLVMNPMIYYKKL